MNFDIQYIFFLGFALLFASAAAIYRWNLKAAFLLLPLMVLSVYRFHSSYEALSMLTAPIVFGSCASYVLTQKKSIQFYLLIAASTAAAIELSHYYYLLNYLDFDLIGQFQEQAAEIIKQTQTQTGGDFTYNIEDLNIAFAFLALVMPFTFFFKALIWSSIAFIAVRISFSLIKPSMKVEIKGLEYFRLNDYFIFVLIAFLAGFALLGENQYPLVHMIALNGLLVSSMLYLVQALGIIRHFLIRKRLPLFILPVGIVTTLLFSRSLLLPISMVLTGWGVLDLWTDFRRIQKKKSGDEKKEE